MRKKIFTELEIEQMEEMYCDHNLRVVDIANKFNCSKNVIRQNINTETKKAHYSKYKIDNTYFERIDTNDKAYFLGLLYADGNMNGYTTFRIALHKNDTYILEIFKKYLKSTHKLIPHDNASLLQIANKKMYNDLIKLGLIPNKSLVLKFPDQNILPVNLRSHFIRGYFDGDGCISRTTHKKVGKNDLARVTFLGTYDFLSDIKYIFESELDISVINLYKNGNIFDYRINRQKDIDKIREYMYYNKSDCFMMRKYEKFYKVRNIP